MCNTSLVSSNFSFSQGVFYLFGELSSILIKFEIVICNFFEFGSLKFVVWEKVQYKKTLQWLTIIVFENGRTLILSQTSPGFYVSAVSLLKTLWEKEKLLATSNFSFSRSVFYPFGKLSAIFIKFKIVVCKLFQSGRVKNLSFGKGLRQILVLVSDNFFSQWNG